ncbi:MAG: hypothetical protein COU29_03575 [Candidatus Magasanikbacteria bacterium CG10_big_fil_rev_8_21_14_0_10_36_32]|uniref:N-acetyltransferase domain-containing protein n=1 Tax=Candidatus Magasanikbacteria bacterium CG10_big_fil_rev_8_21_14_0_10_36_32 TaxID=1974646 RepID=A0A2M6W5I4_9BACT|nr:MAG: hypothetical protein COU29_03575 [Candidatus Magasanikbacteria bacterium CG10_big_fil_rev_8_21_14_0_10_36_32]
MDFRFTNEYPTSRLDEIVNYLLGPRLWTPHANYPDFEDWVQKTHQEIKDGNKRVIIALSLNQIVGVMVYQRHKKYTKTLELKNLTVRPDLRGRYLASFLIKNAEIEGTMEFGSVNVLCDAKANNFGIRLFLTQHRYQIVGETDLYRLSSGSDIIYRKNLYPLLI